MVKWKKSTEVAWFLPFSYVSFKFWHYNLPMWFVVTQPPISFFHNNFYKSLGSHNLKGFMNCHRLSIHLLANNWFSIPDHKTFVQCVKLWITPPHIMLDIKWQPKISLNVLCINIIWTPLVEWKRPYVLSVNVCNS